MYSLRYGTIPIVRVTGGLDDSVVDITENKTQANGHQVLRIFGASAGQSHPKSAGAI